MTTRWEKLAGDTDVFALKIAFAPDPDEGQAIKSEVSVSWGSFQIWVRGRNLCAHMEEGERITSVHWYLLPLMEWFVRYWNPLFHEERLPAKNAGISAWQSLRCTRFPPQAIEENRNQTSKWEREWQGWWTRHALRAAREGGLFPDILFRRLRDSVEVSWGPVDGKDTPEFSEAPQGEYRLLPQAVTEPLHDVLSSAGEYLATLAVGSRRVKALHRNLQALKDTAEHREKRLMWLAGLGTSESAVRTGWRRAVASLSAVREAPRQAMLAISESPLVVAGSSHVALMLGSLAPNVKKRDVLSLAQTMVDLYGLENRSEEMQAVSTLAGIEEAACAARYQGYELADALHERVQHEFVGAKSVNIEELIEKLGIQVKELRLSDTKVRGVSIAGPLHHPGIVVNLSYPANSRLWGRRSTLAHQLCHLLFHREEGSRLAIAGGPWAPVDAEQRANAFAAMLLMPASLVRRAVSELPEPLKTARGVSEIADQLQVARSSMLSHLQNLGYIDDFDKQHIEENFH